ncbi:MAG: helix-turn-helix transcriptional regulator [Comamonadaceae bacterium]|nr:helix-turn-helix transcriptional regulator [Comamonadaceae bacterium]
MFDFNSLPLSPELSRAARNYLGFSQAKAAEDSSLPAHKIKRFEAGNYMPDVEFLQALRDFYEQHGYRFEEPAAKAKGSGDVFAGGVVGDDGDGESQPAPGRHQKTAIHHMRIAMRDEDEMGRVLDLIEANEEKLEALLKQPVGAGFLDAFNEKSELTHVEALKLLAENGAMWARLFGRDLGGTPDDKVLAGGTKPKTHADLLHRSQATAHRAVKGDKAAIAQRKQPSVAGSLAHALGLS